MLRNFFLNLVVVSHYDLKKCVERPAPIFITHKNKPLKLKILLNAI